ncbi:hypothetical protein IFU39_19155 [Paenibacillus sp. CFBP 13594]|uniref:hypothetical protein n=1 Tax=Paenibacillus sp. CFBP 13594 TaxID=2774037 RepID=UPI0017803F64|nr:hypothetical protein [Paenibacillus sp. CFBP 13594]MBD8839936.1 hypothetical protein [Paenibacillus sp. CFBP 13594]
MIEALKYDEHEIALFEQKEFITYICQEFSINEKSLYSDYYKKLKDVQEKCNLLDVVDTIKGNSEAIKTFIQQNNDYNNDVFTALAVMKLGIKLHLNENLNRLNNRIT